MQTEQVLRVVTFVGGVDVIGEIIEPLDSGWTDLWHPFLLVQEAAGQLGIRPMVCERDDNRCIISGKYARINMRNVIWVNPPTNTLERNYHAARAALALHSTHPKLVGVNQ